MASIFSVGEGGAKRRKVPQISPIRNVYDSATTQQADDYDNIMGGYDNVISDSRRSNASNPLSYNPMSPNAMGPLVGNNYSRSGDLDTAIRGLSEYSRTGGYSDSDISNIRERGISPIRSVYANAKRDMSRQRNLQGGRFSNYGALASKMAREQADLLGGASTKVNADIAQMVASGKLNALNSLGGFTSRENELINSTNTKNNELTNEVSRYNTGEKSRVDELNSKMQMMIDETNAKNRMGNTNNELSALSGKSSLYGTTPALTHEFGQQVLNNNAQNMQATQTANALKNQRTNLGLNLVNNQLGRRA